MSDLASPSPQRVATRNRHRDRALGVLAAVVVALVLGLGAPLFGQDLIVEGSGKEPVEVGFLSILVVALGVGLLGWALLAVLERFAPGRAFTIWAVIAGIVLVLSFVPLLNVEAEGATKVVLVLVHLAVAAVLVATFRRTTRG
jgi:uncharacterized protein DUF6069